MKKIISCFLVVFLCIFLINVNAEESKEGTIELNATSNAYNSIKLNVSGEYDGYVIYYSTSSSGKYKKLGETINNSYVQKNVTFNKTYYYKVKGFKVLDGVRSYSNYSSVFTGKSKLASTKVSYSKSDASSITIKYNKVSYASGYAIYYSLDNKNWKKAGYTTKTTYKISKLSNNKQYYIIVRAYRTVSKKKVLGNYSNTLGTYTTPKTPTLKLSGVSYHEIKLSYTNLGTKYVIKRSTDNKKWTTLTSNYESNTYVDEVTPGVKYYYRVYAYTNDGIRNYISSSSSIVNKTVNIGTVSNLKVSTGSTNAKLTFDSVKDASGYVIYYSTNNKKWIKLGVTDINSYEQTGLKPLTKYYYKVRSYVKYNSKNYYSSYTKVVSATTKVGAPKISATFSNTKNVITYKAVSKATSYVIYRSTDGVSYSKIATTKSLSYTDKNITANENYYYVVKAYDGKLYSSNSNVIKNDIFEVTIDKDNGSELEVQKIIVNSKVIKPENPTKEGYTFVRWTLDGKEYDFNTAVKSNITLKAEYRINEYTITFNTDGGNEISNQTIEYNKKVSKPEEPAKEGYTFVKWTLDGKEFDFDTAVKSNIILVAEWKGIDTIYYNVVDDIMYVSGVKKSGYISLTEDNVLNMYSSSDLTYYSNDEIDNIEKIIIEDKFAPNFTRYLFAQLRNVTEIINIDYIDTRYVTNMSSMFEYTGYSAETFNLDLSNWDTSKVTDMSYMFESAGYSATNWNIGDLSNWDTSKVTNMSLMFDGAGYNAKTWNIGNVSKWNVSNVTNMYGMFTNAGYDATTWSIGDLSKWNVSNVTNIHGMFSGVGTNATTWSIGDLSAWDTSKVTDMSSMFGASGKNATTWSIGDLSNWDTSNVTDMSYMFWNVGNNLDSFILDLSNWDTSNVTYMHCMFSYTGKNATTFNIGDLSNWDVSKVTNMEYMFEEAGYSATTWSIGDLSNWNTSNVTSMSEMFESAGYSATNWNIGDLSNWDTSKVTNMSLMFDGAGYNAKTWNIGDLSSWDVSKVTDMDNMFEYAGYSSKVFDIGNISNWNVSNVTNMGGMFYHAGENVTTFNIGDLSSWDVSKVTDMDNMFAYLGYKSTSWSIGDLSNWDTSKVTDMSYMFDGAGYSATTWSIGDLSNWDVSSVTNMNSMFEYTGYSATEFNLDLSNWDTSKVTDMGYMFESAGYNSASWNVIIPKTNKSSESLMDNSSDTIYGKDSSVSYTHSKEGQTFTLSE